MPQANILLVDDDEPVRRAHRRMLGEHAVVEAANGIEAQDVLSCMKIDLVICDLSMPKLDGLNLMAWAKEHCPRPLWIVLTGGGSFSAAVEALKLGAFDFLTKPIEPELFRVAVRRAVLQQQLVDERGVLLEELRVQNARLAENLAWLKNAYQTLQKQRADASADLLRAEKIQQALLPTVPPNLQKMSLRALYCPATTIGGDLYDVVPADDGQVGLYVADAAGHGVSSALLSVLLKQRIRPFANGGHHLARSPADVLNAANGALLDECAVSGLFVSMVYALVDQAQRRVVLSSAGHPPVLVLRRGGNVDRIEKTGPALGLSPEARFDQVEIQLDEGDGLLIYTDGLYARHAGETGAFFDYVRSLNGQKEGDAELLRQLQVHALAGEANQEDDATAVLLRATPGESIFERVAPKPAPSSSTASGSDRRAENLTGRFVDGIQFLALEQSVTWVTASALHDACRKAFQSNASVVLDLSRATSLDSTVLGTLHAIALFAEEKGSLFIQNVPQSIQTGFEELCLSKVLACVTTPRLMPENMEPIRHSAVRDPGELVLQAHELLASLNEKNAAEFHDVVSQLRGERGGASSAGRASP